jgi:hypothetical protein
MGRDTDQCNYYVYRIDRLGGVPIYVGKGGGHPYRDRHWQIRNPAITALIRSGQAKPPVRVAEGMTEAEAVRRESELIQSLGRADLGTGPLLNLTDGPEP